MKRLIAVLALSGLTSLSVGILSPAVAADVSVGISVGIAPPPLLRYPQPVAPGPGYLWTPGYWAWNPAGHYYWVPGVWVVPPAIGLLWTPGYWGFSLGFYHWYPGYWGPQVGFYGGIDYGFGYFGRGYTGGRWRGRDFYYNTAVNNINITHIHNVYNDRTVVRDTGPNRVSYHGGPGGINMQPERGPRGRESTRDFGPTAVQREHEQRYQTRGVGQPSAPRNEQRMMGNPSQRPRGDNAPGPSRMPEAGGFDRPAGAADGRGPGRAAPQVRPGPSGAGEFRRPFGPPGGQADEQRRGPDASQRRGARPEGFGGFQQRGDAGRSGFERGGGGDRGAFERGGGGNRGTFERGGGGNRGGFERGGGGGRGHGG